MVLEIERKFILRDLSVLESLANEDVSVARDEITQFYVEITPVSEVRFRKIGNYFFTAKKSGKGLVREERESPVSKEIFEQALKNSIGIPVEKSRFSFKINNLPCNIDVFHEPLEGLVTLEIEFLTIKDAKNFAIPSFIKDSIQTEITDDERYKNKNLALYGLPQGDFDITKIFEILSANPELKLTFPSGIRSIDALRIVFFQIYKKLASNIARFESTSEPRTLHEIRINIRKIRSLLELFKSVFDKKVADYFLSSFKTLAAATDVKRDIDVFLDFLETQKCSSELAKIFKRLDENETKKLKNALKNAQTAELLKDWEVFVKEQSDFYRGENFSRIVKKTVAKVMRLQILKIKKNLFKLNEQSSNERFHDTRKQIKKLRYLMEIFIDLFSIKYLEKCVKKSKEIQELFGNLQDTGVFLTLLKHTQCAEESLKIREKIRKAAFKTRSKILRKKAKYAKNLGKVSRNLKIYYI